MATLLQELLITENLFDTKLHIPTSGQPTVLRSRLFERLDEGRKSRLNARASGLTLGANAMTG